MNQTTIPKGRKFEEDFFGPRDFRRKWVKFLTYEMAIADAKARQSNLGWNPALPHTPTGRQFFDGVIGNLHLEYQPWLKLYVALGTSLDLHWKTDCFFELHKGGRTARATIDLTLYQRENYNRFMSPDFVLTQEVIEFQGWHEIGRKIAWHLRKQLPRP